VSDAEQTVAEQTAAEQTAAEQTVVVQRQGAVAVVRFNRPDQLNAFTGPMSRAYAAAMRRLDADPQVRAIVVTGNGRGFCAGADLAVISSGGATISALVPPLEELPAIGLRLTTPVVVAVNGPVAGIGFAYLLGGDVRFCAAEAKISTSFARLGLVAEYGLSWLLPRLVGVGRAMDLLLSGRVITGTEAGEIGLVEYVVPASEVFDAALAYATDLAENCSPSSMAAIKAQVLADTTGDLESALFRARWLMERSFFAPDLDEALAARAEKRPPRFAPGPDRIEGIGG
jgi:enoyl-CoA hydratase/carnithine racemase